MVGKLGAGNLKWLLPVEDPIVMNADPYKFEDSDTERLKAMSNAEFNALPFGAVRLDATGRILAFNAAESELSGFPFGDVIGKNFFLEVAPSTNTAKFYGKFKEGVERGDVNVTFEYLFTAQNRPSVRVHMLREPEGDFWLLVKRI
jgi:photoactive yellow protein